MARLLREPVFEAAPIKVPAPGAWDPIAQAAYEQGRADGYAHGFSVGDREGYERGRTELDAIAERTVHAAVKCHDDVRRLHAELVARVIDLADLYVRSVVRHAPDATAAGMLARVEEALSHLEPGDVELLVEPEAVADLTEVFARADHPMKITVVAGSGLGAGEYRLVTEWAEADGTWDRYVAAAHEALTMYIVEHP